MVSLGASWAFSVQPVLPSVWRPGSALEESNLGQATSASTPGLPASEITLRHRTLHRRGGTLVATDRAPDLETKSNS